MDEFCPCAIGCKERSFQKQVSKEGIGDNRERGAECETPSAKESPAENKEWDISNQYHQADGPPCEMIDQLCDSTHATRSQICGDKENAQAESLNDGTDSNENKIAEDRI